MRFNSTARVTHTVALGATAGAVFAIQPHLDAAIIYSGVQNTTVGFASHFGSYAQGFNIDGIGGSEFSMLARNTLFSGTARFVQQVTSARVIQIGGVLQKLASGAVISNANPFPFNGAGIMRLYSGGAPVQGQFLVGQSGFAGLKFKQGADTHYGWIRLRWDDNGDAGLEPNSVTAIDWAYESTPDAAILAGAGIAPVPEPGTALAGLALLGVAALRRRRGA